MMTTNNGDSPLVDPSILAGTFGGAQPQSQADDGGIPEFLRRTEQPDAATDTSADHGGGDAAIPDSPDGAVGVAEHQETAEAPADADQSGVDTGQAGTHDAAGGEATFPTEMTEAGEQHTLIDPHAGDAENERAVVGGNQPPEEPLDREAMSKEFFKDIAAYGRDSGKGAAALPRLGLRVVRAAADGLISTEKPKNGGKSDAVIIYERYAEQDSKHADHTKGGMKANASKLNALIGLGCMTTVDGVQVADRCVALREQMEGAELKPKALFAGLVDVARAQLEQDTELTDDAIKAALTKTQKDKTLEKEWEAIEKKVDALITGEASHGLKDQSETALKIAELIHEHVKAFKVNDERDDQIAFCMERGMSRAQAEEFVDQK